MLDGACRVNDMVARAAEFGMAAVAQTDHGVMYGSVPFYTAAKKMGVKPIVGCEVYVAKGSRLDHKSDGAKQGSNHLVLLATNDLGYRNLVRLVSAAHVEGFYYKPRIDKEILALHNKGLIGLSSCLKGEIAERLVADDEAGALKTATHYAEILGHDNFFLEVQDHLIPDQRKVNRGMVELARKTGLGLVATNDVHYLKREHAAAHEVLLCLQTQTVMSDPKRMKYPSDEFYFKSGDEMAALFKDIPQAIANTVRIAERCSFDFEFDHLHFPQFKIPAPHSQKEYLTQLCYEGMKRRYGLQDPAHPKDAHEKEILERFKHEISVIERTGFLNYFLVVWDFVNFAKTHGIPVGPGRGSGAGSLVAYLLGITGLDPLRYGLIFERFLNPERVSPPDFDIDFCQTRRGEVIEYVKEKYGRDNCAQIITFGSLGAKTVIRDVGRALEIPFAECDRLSKMIPEDPKINLAKALEMNPEFKKAAETNENCKRILEFAPTLEGLFRNAGTHAAGVVIGEKPLIEIVPLALDKDGQIITQYAMEPIGKIGLLKMDFLGLKTLTVIQEAVDLIKRTRGESLDMERLPVDDRPTYELLQRGDAIGVFQLESTGMRDLLRRLSPTVIEELIALIALYRPGPMQFIDSYINRKHGREPIEYMHPMIEPLLKETYGYMVYQEQVQRVANVMAGFSLGMGDVLRRAMGKKKPEEMAKMRTQFIEGCGKTSHMPPKKAGELFDMIEKFAGYGFNKSHSAGYGIVAYQTAYLKAHYPEEFMAALLSSEMGNLDKIPVFINEVRAMGLDILPPHVNHSEVRFDPVKGGIRYGLAGIKNVGEGAAREVVAERQKNGPYKGLMDACARLQSQLVNRKTLESLARCGAFDISPGTHRGRLFAGVEFAMNRAAATQRDRQSGQGSLFDLMPAAEATTTASDAQLPEVLPWTESVLLAGERELLGIYMSGHPLSQYESLLERYQQGGVEGLAKLQPGEVTRLGGLIASVTQRYTKKKEPMAVFRLEDLDGSVEVVAFPDAFREYGAMIVADRTVMVCGEIRREDSETSLVAYEIYSLDDAPKLYAERVSIHLQGSRLDDGLLGKIGDILRLHPGRTPVYLCLEFEAGEKVFLDTDVSYKVTASEALVHAIEHILGEGTVFVGVNSNPCRKQRPTFRRKAAGEAEEREE